VDIGLVDPEILCLKCYFFKLKKDKKEINVSRSYSMQGMHAMCAIKWTVKYFSQITSKLLYSNRLCITVSRSVHVSQLWHITTAQ